MREPTEMQLHARLAALERAPKREPAARQRLEPEIAAARRIFAETREQTAPSGIPRLIAPSQADIAVARAPPWRRERRGGHDDREGVFQWRAA